MQRVRDNQDNEFPSGCWTGFDQGDDTSLRQDLHLTFDGGHLIGVGIDGLGEFVIQGSYCPETLEVTLTKSYPSLPERSVCYRGFREVHGIWGVCDGSSDSSGFHIWPQWEDAPAPIREPELAPVSAPSWLFRI